MESDHANNLNNHIDGAFNLGGSNIADDNDLQQNVPANINDIANEDLNEASVDNELYPREGLALRLAPDGSIIVTFSSTIEVGDIYSSSDDEWAITSISMVPPEGGSGEISTGESAISGEISMRMVSPSILSANVGGQEENRDPLGENSDPLGVQDSFLAQEAPLDLLDLNPRYEIGGSTRTLAPNPMEYHQHESLAPLQYSDIPDSLSQSALHPSMDNGSPSLPESRSFLNTLQSPTSTLVGGPSIRWRPLLIPQQSNYQESGSSNSTSTWIGVDTGNIDLLATQPPPVSSSFAVPMSTAEFSEFSMTYIRERYEQERRNGMTDEEAHYFFNDDINENAGGGGEQSVAEVAVGEEVADPMRERFVELVNQYNRMFRAVELQTPSYDPIMRAQLVSEVLYIP
ncbi:hypothetical protein CRG98_028000 [Punica granatum]|uniref:Uncharacterized protein n=1 Tax=Punica granatum TaxID=22663 RepID=A0A2I0J5Z1_PUNGR|nr:hypothetical protein CRG98_028000 [Punica granatum]